MALDLLDSCSTIGLDAHHIYQIAGGDFRYVYRTDNSATFASLTDPRVTATYEFSTLNRLNAAGRIRVIPFGLMPEHMRPGIVRDVDDILLSGLSAPHRNRIDGRHAMVKSALDLIESKEIKGTDEALAAAMDSIRNASEEYLATAMPEPEYALKMKLWQEGAGRKPKSRSSVTLPDKVSSRTLRRWISLYRKGGKKALVDNCAKAGNRNSYFTLDESALMARIIQKEYLSLQRKSIATVFVDVQHAFREENERRNADGEVALKVPGREAVRQFIKRLDVFRVQVARYGQAEAMKRMRPVKEGIEVSRPFERVEMDEWKIDLLTILTQTGLINLFSDEEKKALDLLNRTKRWWLVAAIECRTRCIVGMTLTADPKTSSALKCLRMVVSDKGQFADAAGALSSWAIFSTPELLAVDNGSAFKSALFTSTCADLGITKLQTIAGQPSMRGRIERVFNTLAMTLLPRLSGRTFGDTVKRARHPAEERACLGLEDLATILTRWVVDVYHNTPHEGLNGRTPLEQWEADLKDGNYPLLAAPTARHKRIAFGLPLERVVRKDGIRILNVRYQSRDLAEWFLKHGTQRVEVRWFDGNIGSVEALLDGVWTEIPAASNGFEGVDATTWTAARRALRTRDAKRKEWEEDVVYRAIADIKALNAERQMSYKIMDHAWTEKRLQDVDNEALVAFDIVPTREKATDAPDGHGRTIRPVAPEKPSATRDAVERAPRRRPVDDDWEFDA